MKGKLNQWLRIGFLSLMIFILMPSQNGLGQGLWGGDSEFKEVRELQQEIMLYSLVNDLDLTKDQIEKLLPALEEVNKKMNAFVDDYRAVNHKQK